jgi:glyoxylase-like metal-dependent hydrolase (beta-lactamase superfamily II)
MQRLHELTPGVLVATSDYATTNSTVAVADDGGCLVIDPGSGAAAARWLRYSSALGSRAVEP